MNSERTRLPPSCPGDGADPLAVFSVVRRGEQVRQVLIGEARLVDEPAHIVQLRIDALPRSGLAHLLLQDLLIAVAEHPSPRTSPLVREAAGKLATALEMAARSGGSTRQRSCPTAPPHRAVPSEQQQHAGERHA